MTARIPNSTPPVETATLDGRSPKRATVSGSQPAPSDGAQVSELSETIAAALGSDDEKVEALRREVSSGTYVVDSIKIAERLLQIEKPNS